MKKFIVMILCVSTFFVGLGGLVESVGARFKSDERALEIVRLARIAIGGEANLKAVQAMTIAGKATKTFEFDKVARIEKGDWELNLQLPNKISKMLKIETENIVGGANTQTFERKADVIIIKKGDGTVTETVTSDSPQKVVIIKKDEGGNVLTENVTSTNGEVRRVVVGDRINANAESFERNDFFRTMISLLLTPPNGTDAEYIFIGEQSVDDTNCEIVQVNSGDTSVKLFLNKSTHLPVMMSYTDAKPFIFRATSTDASTDRNNNVKVVVNSQNALQISDFQVKFSDYRTANGLQLPYKWMQTIDGKADETIEISSYELNPANIADKFKEQPQKIMIRTEKP